MEKIPKTNHDNWDMSGVEFLKPPEKSSEDQAFEHLISAAESTSIEVLKNLNYTNPEAKTEFLADPTLERPHYEYGNLHPEQAVQNLEQIRELRKVILGADFAHKKQLILEEVLDFNARKNRFVLACAEYDQNPTFENKIAQQQANIALYGEPDEDTFWALLNEKIDSIDPDALSPEDKTQYDELLTMIGLRKRPAKGYYRPSEETIQRFREGTQIFFESIFKHIPEDQEEFTPADAAKIANDVIADILDDDTKWHAEVKPNASWASVGQTSKVISFPGKRNRGNYDRLSLTKILGHELGTHALRAMPFENADISMFRTGFPNNETFDEGIAKAVEQTLDDEYEPAGADRYIGIGLANFLHTNFRETFEIQCRLQHLTGNDNESPIFDDVSRCFRGTGVLPNNKDLAYFNGSVKAWKYIEENIDNPMLFDNLFLSGKVDATDRDQMYLSYEEKSGGMD